MRIGLSSPFEVQKFESTKNEIAASRAPSQFAVVSAAFVSDAIRPGVCARCWSPIARRRCSSRISSAIVVFGLPVAERRKISRAKSETVMNRRTLIGAAAVSAALPLLHRVASAQTPTKTKNVVFVHAVRRRLLLVEGHRPPPAEGRQLHQRAESSDVAAGSVGGRAAGDRGAARPDGARGP